MKLLSIKLIFLFTFSACTFSLSAQYKYDLADIPVFQSNDTFSFPFAGGVNSPVFTDLDLNLDGKNDLLVLEIFGDVLQPYINVGDSGELKYSYEPSYLDVLPDDIESWIVSGDYNCDGKLDLFYMHNEYVKVYENLSTSSKFQLGNSRTITYNNMGFQEKLNYDEIYKPAIEDIDGDGDLDFLFFQNGQIIYFKNLSLERTSKCGLDFEVRAKCWGLVSEQPVTSAILLDSCHVGRDPLNERTKGNKHAGGTLTAIDIDGNQTMDLLAGDVSQNHMTLLLNGDITSNRTGSHIISAHNDFPSYDHSIYLKNFPATYYLDLNNDNVKDLLVASFNSDRMELTWTDDMVHYYKNVGNPVNDSFAFQQADFLLGEMIDLGRGAHPIFYDINKDGLLDIVAGNMGNYDSLANQYVANLSYFENIGSSTDPEFRLVDKDFANISNIKLNAGLYAQSLFPAIADINADGRDEMLVGDNNGKIHLFRDSSNTAGSPDFRLVTKNFAKIGLFKNRNCSPTLYDLNKDGLIDLLIGYENGLIEFYPNYGTATEAVFNFEVDSVIYQGNNSVRYYFDQKYDVSKLSVGQWLYFNGTDAFINSGNKKITSVNPSNKFVDVNSPFVTSQNYENEYNSDKVAFYGNDSLGGIDIRNRYSLNGMPTPFFYEYENSTRLLSGSKIGTVYYYSDIDDNLDSNFSLIDTNYLNYDFGRYTYLSGGDINSDGKTDIVVGNEAGGFKIYFANGIIGFEEHQNMESFNFKLYPNPSSGSFTVDLEDFLRYRRLNIAVYDMLGKQIVNQKVESGRMTIKLENAPSGVYFVKISNKALSKVKKVVIKP